MPPISAPCGSCTAANRSRPSWMPVAAKLNLVISSRSWSTAELTGWSTTMIRGLLTGRSVLEDPAEVAKSDGVPAGRAEQLLALPAGAAGQPLRLGLRLGQDLGALLDDGAGRLDVLGE